MAEPHFEQIHGRIKNSFSATSVLSMLSFRSTLPTRFLKSLVLVSEHGRKSSDLVLGSPGHF
jgi:hypothetical protein